MASESGALQLKSMQEDWLRLQQLFGGLFSNQSTNSTLSSSLLSVDAGKFNLEL